MDLLSLYVGASSVADLVIECAHLSLNRTPTLRVDVQSFAVSVLASFYSRFVHQYPSLISSVNCSSTMESESVHSNLIRILDIMSSCLDAAATFAALLQLSVLEKNIDWMSSHPTSTDSFTGHADSNMLDGWRSLVELCLVPSNSSSSCSSSESHGLTFDSSPDSVGSSSCDQLIKLCIQCYSELLCHSLNPSVPFPEWKELVAAVRLSQERLRRLSLQCLCMFMFLPAFTGAAEGAFELMTEFFASFIENVADQSAKNKIEGSEKIVEADFLIIDFHHMMTEGKLEPAHQEYLLSIVCFQEFHKIKKKQDHSEEVPGLSEMVQSVGNATQSELQSIQSVQEVLFGGGYGDGFILQCLREYQDIEQVKGSGFRV